MGPQQSHKGMLVKYAGGGVGGEERGRQKFSHSVMGVGGRFISHVFLEFLSGGGERCNFLGGDQFCQTTTPTTPGL